jgi:hypothetical protein
MHSDPGRLATEVVRFIRSVECRTQEREVAAVVSKSGARHYAQEASKQAMEPTAEPLRGKDDG